MAELSEVARECGIKNFLISYTDLFGHMRAKLVPARAIDKMAREGAGFAGFATWLDMTPAMPDLFAVPDPDSLVQLPWKREVGWLSADLYMEGKPVEQAPRTVLKRAIGKLGELGYEMRTGVECEFFLLAPDGSAIADGADRQSKSCYDQQALMRRYDVITEISEAMQELGWNPYQSDHEDANGQFEMNWEYDEALTTADRHAFFKYMVKSLAEKHGMRATFMPKPFLDADRVRLPRPRLALARRRQRLRGQGRRTRRLGGRLPLPRRPHGARRRHLRADQSDRQFLQAAQRAADAVGRHLVAEFNHLHGQQPHPHDPHSGRRAL